MQIQIGACVFSKLRIFLYYIKCDLIYLLAHLVPVDKNLWIFGSYFGAKCWGNSKCFFEYVSQNCPKIQAVWLTKNEQVITYIHTRGFSACDACSWKGIWLSMRARCCCITHNLYDVNEYAVVASKTKIIQLRRGTPFRYVAHSDEIIQSKQRQPITFPLFKRHVYHWKHALVIASSKDVADVYTRYFSVPQSDVAVTGYPRNDQFFYPPETTDPLFSRVNKLKKQYKTLGMFVPHDDTPQFFREIEAINQRMNKLDILLLVKPYQESELYRAMQSMSNILLIKDSDCIGDIYPILPLTDFLITDYASACFDYMLLGKPVIFVPFEISDKDITFFYNYDDVTPGPKLQSWSEVLNYLEKLPEAQVPYAGHYEKVCRRFNWVLDGTACKRVYQVVRAYCGFLNHEDRD